MYLSLSHTLGQSPPTSELEAHRMPESVSLPTILLHLMMAASVFITTFGILSTQNGSNICHELHDLDPCNKEIAVAVFNFMNLVISVISAILFPMMNRDNNQSENQRLGTLAIIMTISLSSLTMHVFSITRISWTVSMSEGLPESALIWSQSIICLNFSD